MRQLRSSFARAVTAAAITIVAAAPILAQPPYSPAPYPPPPGQLDSLVQRIALYPDPLLAEVLTASTYWNQIPDAAAWANQHAYLRGAALAQAIADDQLPWDSSVLALLPFPQVLGEMAQDPGWTQALGNAVLTERPAVMDAIQQERRVALDYGYLQSSPYVQVIATPGAIQIVPTNPNVIYVPTYQPYVVFSRPRPGFYVGGAIRFGPAVTIGAGFLPFGWAGAGLGWREHSIIIDRRPWGRTWENREHYAHPYGHPEPHYAGPRRERHEERERRDHDRDRH